MDPPWKDGMKPGFGKMGDFRGRTVSFREGIDGIDKYIYIYKNKYTYIPWGSKTKQRMVKKDDPCKGFPILPMGKVWSLDFLGVYKHNLSKPY